MSDMTIASPDPETLQEEPQKSADRAPHEVHPLTLEIIHSALKEAMEDRIPSVAGGITFFFLLALFPALTCIVSVYGMFGDRGAIFSELHRISGFLPGGATTVLYAELHRLLSQKETFNLPFFMGLVIALWSASGGVRALVEGLNIAYEITETRGLFRYFAHTLIFTGAAIVIAVFSIELSAVVPSILAALPYRHAISALCRIAAWPFSFVLCAFLSSVIYHYGANRASTAWRWITWGGAIASAMWMGGTLLFTWYVAHFGHYDQVYGSLGATVGFLTWVWLSLLVLLFGAEINCELEKSPPL